MAEPLNEKDSYIERGPSLLMSKRNRKILIRAYFSWLLLGILGLHRFYVDWSWSGLTMLLMFVVGLLLYAIIVGKIILVALVIWWCIDGFLLPKLVKNRK